MATTKKNPKIPRLSDDELNTFDRVDQNPGKICDPTLILTVANKARLKALELDCLDDYGWYPEQSSVTMMCQDMTSQDIEFMYWILTHLSPSSASDKLTEATMYKALKLPRPQ